MILQQKDRMFTLLWFVAYCGEMPVKLASRIHGHPQWNRHMVYRAIDKKYVDVYRGKYRQHIIRSLRITEKGLDYLAERDPSTIALLLSRQADVSGYHGHLDKVMRLNAVATGLIMAVNAGALILPEEKPSLLMRHPTSSKAVFPNETYYYSSRELRDAVVELDTNSVAKTSRIIGILIRGDQCFCLYYTGFSRMYWRAGEEMNVIAAFQTILSARGFRCDTYRQIIIGDNMHIAEMIARQGINAQSRYLTVRDRFASCHFITNDRNGDKLLRMLSDEDLAFEFEHRVMTASYIPPAVHTRSYDALTPDGMRPVTLNYQFNLMALIQFDSAPEGFSQSPVILCLDYQADAIQKIVGAEVEVRVIAECLPI